MLKIKLRAREHQTVRPIMVLALYFDRGAVRTGYVRNREPPE